MFDEFLLTNRPNEANTVLPDMVRIGSFSHKLAPIPVFLPFLSANGFCFLTDDDNDPEVILQMQYIALDLMKFMDPKLLSLVFVDIGINTRYPILASCKLPHLTFITSRNQLDEELSLIVERAHYVSTQCLGFQYSDLDSYNQNNPNDREAYTVVFISCFPRGFKDEMLTRLSLLIREGKKSGIRFILNMSLKEWESTSLRSETKQTVQRIIQQSLIQIDGTNHNDALHMSGIEIYNRFSAKYGFHFDRYTTEAVQTILDSLKSNTSAAEEDIKDFLCLPIGKNGRSIVNLEMGLKSGIYHGFIAGQSGSGKTNLLHNIITSIALHYSPDELRLYLLDYKWGVEFQVYENHPNVEYLLLDNDNIESGINLLKELRTEFANRSRVFLSLGKTINSIDEYNKKAQTKMPHILIIIDEVQQLFSSFNLRREVNPILKEIAKQGRAFGIHLLFSTQSYAQCDIDSDTLSQMPLRIAFALSSGSECRAILGPENDAPMKLPPYSAIYNTRNGDSRYNNVVKVDFFDKDSIESTLAKAELLHRGYLPFKKRIIRESDKQSLPHEEPRVINSHVVSRPEYDDEDFEKEFGF